MRSALHIRPAHVADAAAACDVLRHSILELCEADHNNDPELIAAWLANKTTENVAAWISNPDNIFLVAINDDQIVGVGAMTRTGMITLNYVSPDARFNAVSKSLLNALEHKARELGLGLCRLESTKTAFAFYRAAGYSEQKNARADNCLPANAGSCRPMVKHLG